ncbi:ectoine synthase [Halothiobacillus sp.]|uniref:ectoine synthase n=1 Tax=Halothiobacillus sp. TaxID=1891311 RepID=UPI002622179B|nr:ectoine synthase [Halothiobacillus sp.]MDD4966274.1 ectoine synthase [Halothiobacillus sp.]
MIVRRLTPDILGTDREVEAENGNWVSRRLVLADDGVGFSFHDTIIRAGTETYIHYANHIEAVYCVAGNGEIHDIANDTTHKISDGMMYLLNNHDRHYLRGGTEDMRLICVFNPPLTGKEVHDENGHYPLMS